MGWALLSPDGVAPSWMVGVSASVNLLLHHKVQNFCSGTSSPGWSGKDRKTVVVVVVKCFVALMIFFKNSLCSYLSVLTVKCDIDCLCVTQTVCRTWHY